MTGGDINDPSWEMVEGWEPMPDIRARLMGALEDWTTKKRLNKVVHGHGLTLSHKAAMIFADLMLDDQLEIRPVRERNTAGQEFWTFEYRLRKDLSR